MDIREICEFIWKLERDHSLLTKEIQGVYFWKLIRMTVFQRLTMGSGLHGLSHSRLTRKQSIGNYPYIFINNALHGLSRRWSRRRILVFEAARKVLVGGSYLDPYTYWLVEKLRGEGESFELVEALYLGRHLDRASRERSYIDEIGFSFLIRALISGSIDFSSSEVAFLMKLEQEIGLYTGVKIKLAAIAGKVIWQFKQSRNYYGRILKRRHVEQVYLVCSYGREALIQACHDNHVECIEMQHGVISKFHLGYSFPDDKHVPYFPDRLYAFGWYWYDSVRIPIPKDKILITGFPYLQDRLLEYKEISKNSRQVLFVSQGTIGRELCKIASAFSRLSTNYSVVYRLHPGEFSRWKDEYPELVAAEQDGILAVSSDNSINLYEHLARSAYVVGVNSTALYESLSLGCKLILVDLPGVEYMQDFIDTQTVYLIRNEDELLSALGDEPGEIRPEFIERFWS